MPIICQKNARMRGYDFEYRGVFQVTYSAIQGGRELAFDSFSLSGCQAIEQRGDFVLKLPLSTFSDSSFFKFFPSFALVFMKPLGPFARAFSLYKYNGMNQVKFWALNPYALMIEDVI